MEKKLINLGSSEGVVLPKKYLETLNLKDKKVQVDLIIIDDEPAIVIKKFKVAKINTKVS